MNLRRAFWVSLVLVAAMCAAILLTGCGNILDMVESVVLKEPVAESANIDSPESEYLAEVKADTAKTAVAAAQAVIESRWGLRLEASDLDSLSSTMTVLQDVLQARALNSEAEALRRLEDTLRALEP